MPIDRFMEHQLCRSSRENIGQAPKRFDSLLERRGKQSSMYRTPINNKDSQGKDPAMHSEEIVPAPGVDEPENHSAVGSHLTQGAAYSARRSMVSRASNRGETDSQLRILELEAQIEEEELRTSIERDRILAEKQLAELKIKQDLALKMEQKKMEFLKKKRERELKINDIRSGSSRGESISSRLSECTSVSKRVTKWLSESDSANQPVRLQCYEPEERRNVSLSDPGVNQILSQALNALQTRNVRDLPSFSGDIMEWTIFENEFRMSTEEFNLTDRENLRRLNKSLQGRARKTVESLLSSHENVGQIMRMLKSNFGRTEWVVANRLEALRNLESVKEGNIESFRVFYNVIIGTKIAMQNVRADNYLMNPELISHLAEKLPAFSKQMWIRHKAALIREGKVIEYNTFSRWLEDEMENQLASLDPVFGAKKQTYQLRPKQMVLNVNNRIVDATAKCPLCSSKTHCSLDKCEQFCKLTVAQRRSVSNSCKVCYVCLRSDHTRRSCKSENKCSICSKNHHELVHDDEFSKSKRGDSRVNQSSVYNVNGKNVNILLRVGEVKIEGTSGVAEVFALFDEASSLFMMDTAVANRIGLHGPTSSVNYRWTNGISHKEDKSMLLSFKISGPANQTKWFHGLTMDNGAWTYRH